MALQGVSAIRGDLVKRYVTGSYSSLADAGTADIALQVPVDVTSGLGIQIWGWQWEYTDSTWWDVTDKYIAAMLSRTTITAEVYVNNQDILDKDIHNSAFTTSGLGLGSRIRVKDLYPAQPYFSNTLHVGIKNASGATQTIYVRVFYSAVMLSKDEMMGLLTNAGVP